MLFIFLRKKPSRFIRAFCSAMVVLLLLAGGACFPALKNYKGNKIFNPIFLFFLDSPNRDKWQMPEQVINALGLAEGQTIADIGAASGYFTERFSHRVGPSGRVYATDVQEIMIKKLTKLAKKKKLDNVTVIRSTFEDSMVPEASCDIAFFSSVYKEIEGRVVYMTNLKKILRPDGRVVILEYRPEADAPGPEKKYRLTESAIIAEFEAAGYRFQESFDFLPWEYFLIFSPDTTGPKEVWNVAGPPPIRWTGL
jgi:SAM-dependent methyltransferase